MKIRKHLTYANVAATLALAGVIGGGGAYAASKIGSGDIKNDSVRSVDLKDGKAVKGKDVRRNSLGGSDIDESKLKASQFAPLAGDQGSCDPVNRGFVDCAETTIALDARSRLLVIATGDFFSEDSGASLTCRISVNGANVQAGASPGENSDNTDLAATDGFAATHITERLGKGRHDMSLRCSQPTGADGRLASASIAVLGISG